MAKSRTLFQKSDFQKKSFRFNLITRSVFITLFYLRIIGYIGMLLRIYIYYYVILMSHHDVTIVKFLSSSSIQLLPLEDRNKSLIYSSQ